MDRSDLDELARKAESVLHTELNIDLSPLATLEVLAEAKFRIGKHEKPYGGRAEILHDNVWMGFGRTDLKDDVATSYCADNMDTLLARVAGYLERGVYGARIRTRVSGQCFSVIDALSDG